MNGKIHIFLIIFVVFLTTEFVMAQEEESAEISLEAYSDDFQESFFEALKQSGIENYDKAINFLLACKKLSPKNEVVDFELGKNYLKLNQYFKAEDYILKAVQADPDNIWYLDALFEVYKIQNDTQKSLEVAKRLATKNVRYKENLVMLYAKSKSYEKLLTLLDEIDRELGPSEARKNQRYYYAKLLENQNKAAANNKKIVIAATNTIAKENPLENIQNQIENLLATGDYKKLLEITSEAIETYPSQPDFYYANGLALNKTGKFKDAILSLETALDFLIDNIALENKVYKELAFAYNALGNTKRANDYLKKEKKGS